MKRRACRGGVLCTTHTHTLLGQATNNVQLTVECFCVPSLVVNGKQQQCDDHIQLCCCWLCWAAVRLIAVCLVLVNISRNILHMHAFSNMCRSYMYVFDTHVGIMHTHTHTHTRGFHSTVRGLILLWEVEISYAISGCIFVAYFNSFAYRGLYMMLMMIIFAQTLYICRERIMRASKLRGVGVD